MHFSTRKEVYLLPRAEPREKESGVKLLSLKFQSTCCLWVPLPNTETLIFLYMEVAMYNLKSQGLESEDMS